MTTLKNKPLSLPHKQPVVKQHGSPLVNQNPKAVKYIPMIGLGVKVVTS